MELSYLPNQESSNRPNGMLDRDQRTAITIARIRNNLSTNAPTIFYEIHHNNNYSYRCKRKSTTAKSNKCTNNYKQINDSGPFRNSIRLIEKHCTNIGYHRLRTKFVPSLQIVFICLTIFLIRPACAHPIPIMTDKGSQTGTCNVTALEYPLQQAKHSYNYLSSELTNYVKLVFNDSVKNLHNTWKTQNSLENYLPLDFEGELPDSTFPMNGVPTQEELEGHLRSIFKCLNILNSRLLIIVNDHNDTTKASKIRHDFRLDNNSHGSVVNYFTQQLNYINQDISTLKDAAKNLNIILNEEDIIPWIPERDRMLSEFIVTREYLKTLKYMKALYKHLINRCLSR